MSKPLATIGIIGDPVAHSISPALHTAANRARGIAEEYVRWHTPLAELASRVATLRAPGMRGANVTLPHKVAVVPLLDQLAETAQVLGAVNTIVREADGTLSGHNTDAPGLRDSLHALGIGSATRATILGAGGAARAAIYALRALDCQQITVINRTLERARQLIPQPDCILHDHDPAVAAALADTTLLINATALGWHAGDAMPLDPALLHARLLVYDMVYRATPLLRAAQACGAQAYDGLDMLVRQAALAWSFWFKQPAPLAEMWAAAREVVDGRA